MTDIIVTVPKGQMEHMQEKAGMSFTDYCLPYWGLSRKPKHLKAGERIYFVEGGKITRRADVTDIHPYLVGEVDIFFSEAMNFPIELKYPSFRGFRYFDLEAWMDYGCPEPGSEEYKAYHRMLMGED